MQNTNTSRFRGFLRTILNDAFGSTPRAATLNVRLAFIGLISVGVSLSAAVNPASGQVAPEVTDQSRVRITAPSLGLHRSVGTVYAVTEGEMVVQVGYDLLTIDRSEIEAMDVAVPEGDKSGQGFAIGAGVGFALGLALGSVANSVSDGIGRGLSRAIDDTFGTKSTSHREGSAVLPFAAVAGLVGGVVGAILGARSPGTGWSAVAPTNVSLAVSPLVGQGTLGVHVGLKLSIH